MKPLPLSKLINTNYLSKALASMDDIVGSCIDDIDEMGMLPMDVYNAYNTLRSFLNEMQVKLWEEEDE